MKYMNQNIAITGLDPGYDLNTYDFDLDDSRIAVSPYEKRDEAKLLVFDREKKQISSLKFKDITAYFKPGDMLVVNETKVFKARLFGTKQPTGARVEILLLKHAGENDFTALIKPSRRVREGTIIKIDGGELEAVIGSRDDCEGAWMVSLKKLCRENESVFEIIDGCGHVPLPPYIVKNKAAIPGNDGCDDARDREGYQTVFARVTGSVAAPTAGFHFTPELITALLNKGVAVEKVVLHVGLGTFKLVEAEDIREHKMHSEPVCVDRKTYEKISGFIKNKNGGRLFCCGTTSVRSIESFDRLSYKKETDSFEADTDIFIYEGYEFKYTDAMITNFHLPKSTLLMMIGAFMGIENMRSAYEYAINNGFLFYSYGDAMLII